MACQAWYSFPRRGSLYALFHHIANMTNRLVSIQKISDIIKSRRQIHPRGKEFSYENPKMKTLIRNGNIFNAKSLEFSGDGTLAMENGVIGQIGTGSKGDFDFEIDAKGAFVLPGFIDAHYHFRLTTMNFRKLARWSEIEFGIAMARMAGETLQRGFTTVRDLGGDVSGLKRAINNKMLRGPRIIAAGRFISQTGGHGDVDGGERAVPQCACQMLHSTFGIVADGADAVRKAARHNLREGSDFLKIHVSGGVATPTDPLESVQYTPEEIRAAVQEAQHRQTYVAAHAYSPESILMAIENGVHSIEHGNLLNAEVAEEMARRGTTLVPTLATYEAMQELGVELGLPKVNRDKNSVVYEAGLASLELAKQAGVTLGWGTDLVGEAHVRQNREFAIRAEVESGKDILKSMYQVNSDLCHLSGQIGVLAEGAAADIVIVRENPLDNIRSLADPQTSLMHVFKAGVPVTLPS